MTHPRRRVCVVITARPSYARIKTALRAIQAHDEFELELVVAASALLERYGATVDYIEKDGFSISARVYMVLEGENLVTSAKSTGLGLTELATVFDNLRPDIVVTIADRYETLATAAAAAYTNTPVAHLQGGEVTGSIDEKVRHAVTKLSDIHLVATQQAREFVIRMGEDPETVFVTGGPDIDLAREIAAEPEIDFDPFEQYGGVGERFSIDDGYAIVIQHPVTTQYDEARPQVEETLHALHGLDLPDTVVLAERRRGLGRHVQGHTRLPRDPPPEEHPLLPQHAARGFPPALLRVLGHRRQLECRDQGGRVPRCSRCQRRRAPAGSRARAERRRHGTRPPRDHGSRPDAAVATVASRASTSTATVGPVPVSPTRSRRAV